MERPSWQALFTPPEAWSSELPDSTQTARWMRHWGRGKSPDAVRDIVEHSLLSRRSADGRIVVGGMAHNGSNFDFALARYMPNGDLDLSFGAFGRTVRAIGSGNDFGQRLALQADGKILLGGDSFSGDYEDFAIARFETDGTLDLSFGTNGVFKRGLGSQRDSLRGLAVQPDGKIVATGYVFTSSNVLPALLRLNTNGTLDPALNAMDSPFIPLVRPPAFIPATCRSFQMVASSLLVLRLMAAETFSLQFDTTAMVHLIHPLMAMDSCCQPSVQIQTPRPRSLFAPMASSIWGGTATAQPIRISLWLDTTRMERWTLRLERMVSRR